MYTATDHDIPVYPHATEVDSRTVSLLGGGGGADITFTSDDPMVSVVAFYAQRFGPGDKDSLPGKCRWFFSEDLGDWRSCRMVVVESAGAAKGTRIYIGRRELPLTQD